MATTDKNGKIHLFPDGIPNDIQKSIDKEMADYNFVKKTGLCCKCKKKKAESLGSRMCKSCFAGIFDDVGDKVLGTMWRELLTNSLP